MTTNTYINSSDLIEALELKAGMASTHPYSYAFGLAWASLDGTQQARIMKIVEEMENLEDLEK